MRRWPLVLFVLLPGVAVTWVSGLNLLWDWRLLSAAFGRFQRAAESGADLRQLLILQTYEQSHRLNCFAEGVGVLLGLVLVAIALHGLSLPTSGTSGTNPNHNP